MPDERALTVGFGLTREMVAKLKERSIDRSDQELQENTSDRTRFGTGEYESWFSKGRFPFVLTDGEGLLAALIWIGPKPFPLESGMPAGAWDTIAFRSYPPYRGQGIMTPFSRFVLTTYREINPGRAIWLATDRTNEAGIRLYGKLGFTDAGYGEDESRRIMTLESA